MHEKLRLKHKMPNFYLKTTKISNKNETYVLHTKPIKQTFHLKSRKILIIIHEERKNLENRKTKNQHQCLISYRGSTTRRYPISFVPIAPDPQNVFMIL